MAIPTTIDGAGKKNTNMPPSLPKNLVKALQDLYTAALTEKRGNLLRGDIRRLAKRFLTEEQRMDAEDVASLRTAI